MEVARAADKVGIPQVALSANATNTAAADPARAREALARRLRQLSGQLSQARAKADQADPELAKMGRRLQELQQETVRLRAEYDQRLNQLPHVRELMAAQEAVRSSLSRADAELQSGRRGPFGLQPGGQQASNVLMRGTMRSVTP